MGLPALAGKQGKNVVYRLDHRNLNFLDKVARTLLAIAYSGAYNGQDAYNQGYIGARCIAVAIAAENEKVYVAANDVPGFPNAMGPTLAVMREINAVDGLLDPEWVFLPYPGNPRRPRDYHAEMQILDYFRQNNLTLLENVIGVSKPCCSRCKAVLDVRGIDYSYFHDQPTGRGGGTSGK